MLAKKILFPSELTNFITSLDDFLSDKGGWECSGLLHFTKTKSPKFMRLILFFSMVGKVHWNIKTNGKNKLKDFFVFEKENSER